MNDTVFGGLVKFAGRVQHLHPRLLCMLVRKRLTRPAYRRLHLRFTSSITFGFSSIGTSVLLRRSDICHGYPFTENFDYSLETPILPNRGVFV